MSRRRNSGEPPTYGSERANDLAERLKLLTAVGAVIEWHTFSVGDGRGRRWAITPLGLTERVLVTHDAELWVSGYWNGLTADRAAMRGHGNPPRPAADAAADVIAEGRAAAGEVVALRPPAADGPGGAA